MNRNLLLFGLALAIVLILAVGCGEDSVQESADPTATVATATEVPVPITRTPPSADGATGIPELDAVIDALRSGEPETLRPLLRYMEVTCRTEGEVEATECELFPFSVCEAPEMLRPETIGPALSVLTESELYAVYRAADHERYPAEYVAIVSDTSPNADGFAWAVLIEDGRIFRMHFSCAAPADEFAEGFDNPVLPPQLP